MEQWQRFLISPSRCMYPKLASKGILDFRLPPI
jgi:hypothetical protein